MKRPDWHVRFSRATEDWHARHRKTIEIIVATTMFIVTAGLFLVGWLVGPNLVINGLLALAVEAFMAAVIVVFANMVWTNMPYWAAGLLFIAALAYLALHPPYMPHLPHKSESAMILTFG